MQLLILLPLCILDEKEGGSVLEERIDEDCSGIFTQEMLKCIACLTMLIDHIGAVFFPEIQILRIIGRVAFPIYGYLLSEGFHYTHNRKKYLMRLTIGAIVAELPFDFALFGGIVFNHQSVMLTLLIGFLGLWIIDSTKNLYVKGAVTIPFVYAAEFLHTDYGGWGVAFILLLGVARELTGGKWVQFGIIALMCATKSSRAVHLFGVNMGSETFGMLSILFFAFYNGRKTTNSKIIQWGFYLFYPVHLAIIWLIHSLS